MSLASPALCAAVWIASAVAVAACPALADAPDAAPKAALAGLRGLQQPGGTLPAPKRQVKAAARARSRLTTVAVPASLAAPVPLAAPVAALGATVAATPIAPGAVYGPPAPAATPVSPAAPAVMTIAQASPTAPPPSPDRPRRYSLHRDYGETPDPAPQVTPTFLDAPPVDLAAPPPPEPRGAALRDARDAAADPDRTASAPEPQAPQDP
jgi:hypothetical protein